MTDIAHLRSNSTVLVVEDDRAMRELMVEELMEAGYRVIDAEGGRSGLRTAREEPVDLVITDLRMPDLDGFDLIRDIKANPSSPHIIMITAFGSIETAIKAVKLGAYDYITKPFEIEELVLVADKALGVRSLTKKVERLQREVEDKYRLGNIVGTSVAMKDVLAMATRIADSDISVLITGESGTGKELIARAIHYKSPRSEEPFVAVNLAAIPEGLTESELFGHKKGAFTDARSDKTGLFREAHGGTLFLDEVGEMPIGLQPKLLRALQEGEIRPVGATKTESVDVRVVAATNRDLEEMRKQGQFREDLYYRLNVVQVDVPPLRQRPEDITPLVSHFLEQSATRLKRAVPRLTSEAQRALNAYRWPGNVRELQNVVERGVALSTGETINEEELPAQVRERTPVQFLATAVARKMTLADLEREYILLVLSEENGHKTRTAKRLGLDRKTLYRKLDEYGKNDG